VLFLSCSEKRESENVINYDSTETISIPDIFESIDVVQLETNDDCLISSIYKVIFQDDRYYVLDQKLQTLFCFDAQGKSLFKIFRKGQGPDEYLYLGDFNVDPYNHQLLLLEPFGGLLLFEPDGTFIKKVKLPQEIVAYNEVYPLDKERLLFISSNKYQVVFYDRVSNTITEKRYETDEHLRHVFNTFLKTYTYNGDIYFSLPATNEIVNLRDSSSFSWDFGKKNNSPQKINKLRQLIISEGATSERDYVGAGYLNYDIGYNYETDRYKLCLLACGNLRFRHIFFDRETKITRVFDKTTENIRFIYPDFSGESIILYDRGFSRELLHPFYDERNLTDEQKNLIKSYNPENDNPFLVKYNFKKLN
jgi:hypothetical protein